MHKKTQIKYEFNEARVMLCVEKVKEVTENIMDMKYFDDKNYEESIRLCLEEYVDELLPDEALEHILAPVRNRIDAGEFDRKPSHIVRRHLPQALVAASVTIALGALILVNWNGTDHYNEPTAIEVRDVSPPLSGAVPGDETVQQVVSLVSEYDGETMEFTVVDGVWKIVISQEGSDIQLGRLVIENNEARIVE